VTAKEEGGGGQALTGTNASGTNGRRMSVYSFQCEDRLTGSEATRLCEIRLPPTGRRQPIGRGLSLPDFLLLELCRFLARRQDAFTRMQ